MDISSSEISVLVFRRETRDDLGEFSMDSKMLAVLMELDGTKKLPEVVKKTGMDMVTVRECVSKLMAAKLIAPVEDKISKLDREFFDYLGMQLSLAVGPIAQVLIEEAVMDLGHDKTRFPTHRVAELIDLLAREIQREDKKAVFKQNMIQKIRERGELRL